MDKIKNNQIIVHDFPAWREHSNFIIAAKLVEPDSPNEWRWEQIWARKIDENLFEICCIPFFTYGLALGDLINTKPSNGRQYVINEIVEKSGHITYRIWFLNTGNWNGIIDDITNLGCIVEVRWEKSKLIAVDAPNFEIKEKLELYLTELESKGSAKCELSI
jgi:hypothetical protein